MNARVRLLSVIPVAVLVFVIFFLEIRQRMSINTAFEYGRVVMENRIHDTAKSLPVIDFPLMSEARPVDLINKELDFPDALKKLEGRRVSLIGFMAPYDSLNDMWRCMIVPSYVGCTFCSPPKLTQVVYVTQGSDDQPARSYPFIEEASQVVGTLRLSLPGSDHEGQQEGFQYSLENAVVTAYKGDAPERAPGHKTAADHKQAPRQGQGTAPLASVALSELVEEVADLLGREPLPIAIEPVSADSLGDFIRSDLEEVFPERTRTARAHAFSLLGMLPEDANWLDDLARIQLAWRIAATDKTGERIRLLDYVSTDHPYIRLVLVGEIAEALIRQHFYRGRDGKDYQNDDVRRAHEALLRGIGGVAMYRYAQSRGVSASAQPPIEFIQQQRERRTLLPGELRRWQSLPDELGPFFIEFLVGPNGPLSRIDPVLAQPPSTTIEFFRPRWYEDRALWRRDPVPSDFADNLLEFPPILTDVLGVGGLVPWLAQWYSVDVAKTFCGGWAGDRWAVWQFPDGSSALLLETRWQDDDSALQFHDAVSDTEVVIHEAGSRTVRLLKSNPVSAIDLLTSSLAAALENDGFSE
jgi:hypothetical protein